MDFEIKDKVLIKYNGNDEIVTIPLEVKHIGKGAFNNNTIIKKVIVGENVKSIGERAFSGCSSLCEVIFKGHLEKIEFRAFEDCKALTEFTLPDGIQELNISTFGGCDNLSHVILPQSLKKIDTSAFSWVSICPLKELILPDSVEELGSENIGKSYPFEDYDSCFNKIHLGKNLRTIESSSPNYYYFNSIENSTDFNHVFDKKLSGIGEYTEEYVYADFSIDEDNPYYSYENGFLLSKDKKTLYSCMMTYVNEIIVPDGVEIIKGHAFCNVTCEKLVIPGTVKEMVGAFVSADIGKLVFSEGISEIEDWSLMRNRIREIDFGNVSKVGRFMLIDSFGLKCLRLNKNIQFLKYEYAFRPMKGEGPTFWFNKDAGFNDLEFVELLDDKGNVYSRFGLPTEKESRSVKEEAHEYLDYFVENGTALSSKGFEHYYKSLKNKTSKLFTLYGILSMKEISDPKYNKFFLQEIKKYKKDLNKMMHERYDEQTQDVFDVLIH